MDTKKLILLRYGEIHLKGNNRGYFENTLITNIKHSLKDFEYKFQKISGRYLISDFEPKHTNAMIEKLTKIFGLVSLSSAIEIQSEQTLIEKSCLEYFEKLSLQGGEDFLGKTFKVTVKRADKKFPFQSDKFAAHLGGVILEKYPELKVNLTNPDIELFLEIRENGKTYIIEDRHNGTGGMPVGTSGEGLLMLSGGIDSPVAGYCMAKRGLKLSAIHFHSFPYTSVQAKEKVIKLAEIVSEYSGRIKIFIVPFTKIQESIHKNCDSSYMITIMRRIMLRIAEKVCEQNNLKTIITGESLGQVASQTIESITVTNDVMKVIPVLRPLIGSDKSEIIKIAEQIGTFQTSILPYEDCCTVFLPDFPVIKPTIKRAEAQEKYLDMDSLIQDAINNIEVIIV